MAVEMLEVGDVMTPNVITEDEEASATKLSKEMELGNIGSIVITKAGKPVGIVTDRDIALKVCARKRNPSEVRAREIMSSPLITIERDASLEHACELIAAKGVRRLPVIDGEELVGIVSVRNILTRSPTYVHKLYPSE
ncbi:MAG TPA: CBS domain-containing protein [Methanomicrobia archaeon]|nr:CBS domain-containing protein [Methanomicrobia archaeon]